jgi:hypothetical protein
LKKQSQFLEGQNDVNLVMTRIYGDFNGRRRRKNKANSRKNKANSKPNKANLFVRRSAFSGLRKVEEHNFKKQTCPEQRRMEPI